MGITEKQKQHLRTLAHKLKPVVTIGDAGLSDAVIREIDLTITHHELIKVRVHATDHDEGKDLINTLCTKSDAILIQSIGHLAVIYRATKKPTIKLP